jgi:O-acetyl-ADP-ribose deacetylase (regulator of RNase III)
VSKIIDKNHVSVHYDDDTNKKKCPLWWTMPEKRIPFDPSTAEFGQPVLLRPVHSRSKHARKHWEVAKFLNTTKPPKAPSKPDAIANQIVRLWKGDVTHLQVDAVQNAANSGLWAGSGLCGAIHKAAGHKLAKACRKFPVIHQKSIYSYDDSIFGRADASFGRGDRCDVGDTKITPGYNLPSKYVRLSSLLMFLSLSQSLSHTYTNIIRYFTQWDLEE